MNEITKMTAAEKAPAKPTKRARNRFAALGAAAAMFTAFAALSSGAAPVLAAGPQGFETAPAQKTASGPKGFEAQKSVQAGLTGLVTVKQVIDGARDEDIVSLRGRFTRHLEDDKYEFVDEAGDRIRAELDDDEDWTMIAKDQLVEIEAEVDRYKQWLKLEVRRAKPL